MQENDKSSIKSGKISNRVNKYEGIFIFKPDLDEKGIEKEYSNIEETIKKNEGRVEKSEKWGKRRLTFEIKKFRDGFFLYLAFDAIPRSIKIFTEAFKINNNILRAQIVRKK